MSTSDTFDAAARPLPRRLALPEQLRAAGFTRLRLVVPGPDWQPSDVATILDRTPDAEGAWLQVRDRADVPAATTSAAQIMRGEWVHVPWSYHVDDGGVPFRFVVIYTRKPDDHDPQAAIAAELAELVDEAANGLIRTV